jgi:hypothetical protein
MATQGLFIGQTPPKGLSELLATTRVRFAWTPDEPAGVPAASIEDQTASLSSRTKGAEPTSPGDLGRSLQPSETHFEPVEDTMSETDCADRPDGVVVSLVLLGATLTIGGFAGFLLALLLR